MYYVIPKPNEITPSDGAFLLSKTTKVEFDPKFPILKRLAEASFKGAAFTEGDENTLSFKFCEGFGREEYRITTTKTSLVVEASTEAGALYGYQTLRQLFRLDWERGNRKMHNGVINDKPKYAWRGLMFDEARHFFGKEVVKQMLDYFAFHKLNVFHWHLSDDQGWRIQIDAYPRLEEISSKRKGSQLNGWHRTEVDWTPHEGIYSKDDIREIVQYAADRNIMVVPEIDMPAHCMAAIAAYPELSCNKIELEVPYYFGATIPIKEGKGNVFENIVCAGKESTFEFLFKVLDEICELFPAPYFHIGGDEAPKTKWKECPDCQRVMRENNLKNEEELQGYFNNRIADHIKKYGKSLIGWNEILKNENLSKDAIAQYWTHYRDPRAEQYVKDGGRIVMSKHQAFYFDMSYAQLPLKNTYNFTEKKFKIENNGNVLGVEGAVWTEWIADKEKLDLSLFPRMEALAEVGWTEEANRKYKDFKIRLRVAERLLEKQGIFYAEEAVANPSFWKRGALQATWYNKDPNVEVGLNKAEKANRK